MSARRVAVAAAAALLASLPALAACQDGAPPAPAASSTPSTHPAGTPSSAPSSSPSAPSSRPRTLTIVMTGDVLLHPPLWAQARADARAEGSRAAFDFRPLLRGQRDLVRGADLALCHLETPLAREGGPYRGYPSFTVPPQIAPALVWAGYDACTTASNHTLDDGTAGVDRTLATLDRAGLRHAGSARSADEASRPLLLDVHGTTVALLAYAYGLNGVRPPSDQPWRVRLIDPERILADAHRARAAGADVVVVALHWGTEYVHDPTPQQRALAERLTASPDVDLVYGHHAHVVQPVQKLHGRWVVYGLGNTVAVHAVRRVDNREGLLVRVQLVRGSDGRWRSGRLDWVPSTVGDAAPYRWRPLDGAGERRVEGYVDSLGAAEDGAHELTP
ncbi:CapA family protein [Angustibacter peucedani]